MSVQQNRRHSLGRRPAGDHRGVPAGRDDVHMLRACLPRKLRNPTHDLLHMVVVLRQR
jgi:hypothetical protein